MKNKSKKVYAVRIDEETHRDISALSQSEARSYKTILKRAVELYKKKGGESGQGLESDMRNGDGDSILNRTITKGGRHAGDNTRS